MTGLTDNLPPSQKAPPPRRGFLSHMLGFVWLKDTVKQGFVSALESLGLKIQQAHQEMQQSFLAARGKLMRVAPLGQPRVVMVSPKWALMDSYHQVDQTITDGLQQGKTELEKLLRQAIIERRITSALEREIKLAIHKSHDRKVVDQVLKKHQEYLENEDPLQFLQGQVTDDSLQKIATVFRQDIAQAHQKLMELHQQGQAVLTQFLILQSKWVYVQVISTIYQDRPVPQQQVDFYYGS